MRMIIRRRKNFPLLTRLLFLVLPICLIATAGLKPFGKDKEKESVSREFAQLIKDFSEPEGYFDSDNFISNESGYLHVVDRLRALGITDGAYIGVGPDQNFTYIAKVRPKIAYLIDIRRQAILQHLMYKAIFEMGDNRAAFLSILFGKPLTGDDPPDKNTDIEGLVKYFKRAAADATLAERNLSKIKSLIKDKYKVELSSDDEAKIDYIGKAFCRDGLSIRFRSHNPRGFYSSFYPELEDILLETSLNGERGNYLNSNDDFNFVKQLHAADRIIPVVGDFAGKHALYSIANHIKAQKLKVRAFYVSNVEFYLMKKRADWEQYVANVKELPIDGKSVFVRSYFDYSASHPDQLPNYRTASLLQRIESFLKLFKEEKYQTYWDLATLDYIKSNPESGKSSH